MIYTHGNDLIVDLCMVSLIGPDGYHKTVYANGRSFAVLVRGGKLYDATYADYEYRIGEDGWLLDWAGSEIELSAASKKRLAAAIERSAREHNQ